MVRTKRPVKRSRGEASSDVEPPPEDHPMAQWFMSKKDFNRLARQNLINHVKIKEVFYPDLIATVYATLQIKFSHDDLEITFKLGHETHSLDSSELISLWKLDYSSDEMQVDTTHDARGYSRETACNMFNIPFDLPKPTVGHLSLEHRLVHYLIVYVMVPRLHNHGLILEEDLKIMWRIVSGHKINWITLIASLMQRNMSGKVTKGLPYAMLWTTIFKYLEVDLNNAIKKELEYNHCIDNHVLNHMKREINRAQGNVEEGVQLEQEVQEEEEFQNAQEVHAPPPLEQPSMMDLMRELQLVNRNIGRLDRRLQRVEQHLGIQDDEEDQD
ncbi:hypothetical protein PIB30_066063 [Stylosanthes scabra]|uniref:Uncharacterized protein n=1 Tax=Stylosanthes scabra TaxID=79078 RepID=A0ABU6SP38_9FABA|nr:hypothetical protein [Stylosanthes scabra]